MNFAFAIHSHGETTFIALSTTCPHVIQFMSVHHESGAGAPAADASAPKAKMHAALKKVSDYNELLPSAPKNERRGAVPVERFAFIPHVSRKRRAASVTDGSKVHAEVFGDDSSDFESDFASGTCRTRIFVRFAWTECVRHVI